MVEHQFLGDISGEGIPVVLYILVSGDGAWGMEDGSGNYPAHLRNASEAVVYCSNFANA